VGDLDRPRRAREGEGRRDRERGVGEGGEGRRPDARDEAARHRRVLDRRDPLRAARDVGVGGDLQDRRPQVRPGRRRGPQVLRGRRPEPRPAAERPELVAGRDDERLVRGHPGPRVADLDGLERDAVALDDERERATHGDALRAGGHLRRDDRRQRLLRLLEHLRREVDVRGRAGDHLLVGRRVDRDELERQEPVLDERRDLVLAGRRLDPRQLRGSNDAAAATAR
jgi:hypothetical protein